MTVRNVTASSIAFAGLFATRSSGLQMNGNAVRRSGAGIALRGTSNSVVSGNQLTDNQCIGIELFDGSTSDLVDANTVTGHGCEGILLADGASGNAVTRNTVTRNDGGIGIAIADGNLVSGNTIRRNHFVGIYLFGADNNRIDSNVLAGNGEGSEGGIHVLPDDAGGLSKNNTVTRNTISGTVGDGILIDAGSPSTVLDRNVAYGNSDDGIDVDEPKTTLRANRAYNNGDLGIEAVAGVTDAGGNSASGNGNPRQCRHVAC
jgi:parallel beta-helix repeat protein